jgi:peptide/nickel transport system ATP-binding protein
MTPSPGPPDPSPPPLLAVAGLSVTFPAGDREVRAVRNVSFEVADGEVVGIAGESGSGKTATALAVLGLLPWSASVTGSIRYRGRELRGLSERDIRAVRGRQIAMVFQETVTALNPVLRVREQMLAAVRAHHREPSPALLGRVREALRGVQLEDVERVLRSYPAELSGGMCQRVMIAMALSCGSRLLIADEPTTALDVSVQAEILALIRKLVAERGLGVLLISHDLAVLNEVCDRLVVLFRGEVVESGSTRSLLAGPRHPYTRALVACLPRLEAERREPPEALDPTAVEEPIGCHYRPRCRFAADVCAGHPALEAVDLPDGPRLVRCWRHRQIAEPADGEGAASAALRDDGAIGAEEGWRP